MKSNKKNNFTTKEFNKQKFWDLFLKEMDFEDVNEELSAIASLIDIFNDVILMLIFFRSALLMIILKLLPLNKWQIISLTK